MTTTIEQFEEAEETLDQKEIDAVYNDLAAATKAEAKAGKQYDTAAKRGLASSEGKIGLCRYGRDLHQSFAEQEGVKRADKALRALNNAIARNVGEGEEVLTLNQKTEEWLDKAKAATRYNDKKYMVLIVKPERTKAEVSPEEAFCQEAFNELRKAMRECEKEGTAPEILKNYLDAVTEAGQDWLIALQEKATQNEQKAA